MDYCTSCRRHLNGALVCPGCGAYAPDIAPPVTVRLSDPPRTADSTWPDPTWPDPAPHGLAYAAPDAGAPDAGAPDAGPVVADAESEAVAAGPAADAEGAPPASRGRAARRRQRARWKKSRRRAAVATAVAIVGGGLTVASMERGSAGRAQAATAPDHRAMGGLADEQPARSDGPAPAVPTAHRTAARTTAAAAQAPATDTDRQRSLSITPRTAPPAVRQVTTRQDTATPPRPAGPSTPRPQSAAPAPVGTTPARTSTAPAPATPATPAADGTASGTTGSAPAPASTPTSTSSSRLCLVVVCLG
ncbi:hypothetical protein [Streptomyces sp. NPDC051452]|uniref:SCO2400 family protein n=1 Tax=Streptomyces sp. NPDC051452 TaxID=3365654 RepID=UPI0037BCE3B1